MPKYKDPNKAAAKREEMKKLLTRLKNMTQEQKEALAAEYPIFNVDGRRLSFHNNCQLILQGCKDVVVGGFRQWKQVGRYVRKGEKAYTILFPKIQKDENNETNISGFSFGSVFGESQTEVWEGASNAEEENGDGE